MSNGLNGGPQKIGPSELVLGPYFWGGVAFADVIKDLKMTASWITQVGPSPRTGTLTEGRASSQSRRQREHIENEDPTRQFVNRALDIGL